MNTEPNTTPEPVETFFEVNFVIVNRKECQATVKAKTRAEAEAIVELLNSDVLDYGPDGDEFHENPECVYEEETCEDISVHGPFTAEDL